MSAARKKKGGWKEDPLAGTGASKKPAVNVTISIPLLSPEQETKKQADLLIVSRIADLVNGSGTYTEEDHPGAAMTGLYADRHSQFWYHVRCFVCPSDYVLPTEPGGTFEYSIWRCESQNAFKRYFHNLVLILPEKGLTIDTDRREMDDVYEKKKITHAKTTVYELAEIFVAALSAEYRRA